MAMPRLSVDASEDVTGYNQDVSLQEETSHYHAFNLSLNPGA